MLVLALDTSTPAVTTVVAGVRAAAPGDAVEGVETLATAVTVDPRRHGELLAPAVRDVLTRAGRSSGELDAVVAGVGPGPFTGLRVGLVTAATLGDALGVPTYGVCSLDAVAAGVAADAVVRPPSDEPRQRQRLLVATDARRREVYWAAYDEAGRRFAGPEVTRPADLVERLPELGVAAMVGAGAALYADVLGLPLVNVAYPDPAGLVALARVRVLEGAPSELLTPLYLRRPDVTLSGPTRSVTQERTAAR